MRISMATVVAWAGCRCGRWAGRWRRPTCRYARLCGVGSCGFRPWRGVAFVPLGQVLVRSLQAGLGIGGNGHCLLEILYRFAEAEAAEVGQFLLDGRKAFFEGHGFPFCGSKGGGGAAWTRCRAGNGGGHDCWFRFILTPHCKPTLTARMVTVLDSLFAGRGDPQKWGQARMSAG